MSCIKCGKYLHPMYPTDICKICREKWEEEFEDEIWILWGHEGGVKTVKGLEKLVEKHLGTEEYTKVKIKARKGKIVIEKIK